MSDEELAAAEAVEDIKAMIIKIVDVLGLLADYIDGLESSLDRGADKAKPKAKAKRKAKPKAKRKTTRKKKPGPAQGTKPNKMKAVPQGERVPGLTSSDTAALKQSFTPPLDLDAARSHVSIRIMRRLDRPVTPAELSAAFTVVGADYYAPRLCGIMFSSMRQFERVGRGLYKVAEGVEPTE